MREYMPYSGGDPEKVRRYAAGELSFDDIAVDRGPKIMNTFDTIDAVTFAQVARREARQPDEEKEEDDSQSQVGDV